MANNYTPSLARIDHIEIRLYKLRTVSHMAIGSGEASAEFSSVEKPIIRAMIYEGNSETKRIPYIPGSTLHGVFRAWVEKALRSLGEPIDTKGKLSSIEETLKKQILDKASKEKDVSDEEALHERWEIYAAVCDIFSELDKCEEIPEREAYKKRWLEAINRKIPCTTCGIFGYMGQRGRVRFTHAFPSEDYTKSETVDIITRVAINRYTGAADPGKLFDLEAVPPGVSFFFFMIMENINNAQKTNLDYAEKALKLQLATIGAHSTVGFGSVEVEKVYAVSLKPKIFDKDLEAVSSNKLCKNGCKPVDGASGIDWVRYPDFFRCVSLRNADGQLPEPFQGVIEIINPQLSR